MKIVRSNNNCSVIKISTPDGKMFVTVMEHGENEPLELQIAIGKTGTQIRAWTDAVQFLASLALKNGATLSDIITCLSMVTSHKLVYHAGVIPIRSGPEGISYALRKYLASTINSEDTLHKMPFLDQEKINEY